MLTSADHAEPRIGVVVLNWNGTADSTRCIASLRDASPRPSGVVIVDNASREHEFELLRAWIDATARQDGWRWAECEENDCPPVKGVEEPWLVLQRLTTQRGFSGGNNAGIRTLMALSQPTHLLLLNNDTVVTADFFAHLTESLRTAPAAVLLSGTIHEMEEPHSVWYAGGRFLPWRALVLHDYEELSDATARATDFVSGCSLVISRRALDMLGPLPECYFPAYMEDAEYSWRAQKAGVAVLHAPRPLLYHRGGASAGRATESPWPAYLNVRHRVFFARRNLSGVQRIVAIGYLIFTKPARAVVELVSGRPSMASALVRGLISGLFSPDARQQLPPR